MSYIHRAPISDDTKEMVWDNAEHNQVDENGQMVSPNGTGEAITEDTKVDIGHKPGFENKHEVEFSEKAGLTQEQHNELFTNPGSLQIEPRGENRSHQFENHDHNDAMQNVSAYAYSQDSNIATNTYIYPSDDGKAGTISVVNAQTGEENTICSYELPSSDTQADLSTNATDDTASNTQTDDAAETISDEDSYDASDDDAYTA